MPKHPLRNRDVIETIIKRNSDTVYRIAYVRCGNTQDAEDIMQEVFLRFIKYEPYFENNEHEKAWFIRTTINRTNSLFASPWKRRFVALNDDIIHYDDYNDGSVLDAVMKLPKDISTAIHLFYYEDMSVKEISNAMKKSESAVKSLLFRGRKLLKISLEDYNEKG